jgi:hypothetical protein
MEASIGTEKRSWYIWKASIDIRTEEVNGRSYISNHCKLITRKCVTSELEAQFWGPKCAPRRLLIYSTECKFELMGKLIFLIKNSSNLPLYQS